MAQKRTDTKRLDIESALSRLEEVAKGLSEEIGLEEALALYAEGVELVNYCNKELEAVERKISILRTSPDGEVSEQSFPAESV